MRIEGATNCTGRIATSLKHWARPIRSSARFLCSTTARERSAQTLDVLKLRIDAFDRVVASIDAVNRPSGISKTRLRH